MTHCARCGTEIPPGSNFCPRCGAPLSEPPPLEPSPVAPVPVAPVPVASAPPRVETPPPAAPPPRRGHMTLWVLLTVVILGLVLLAILTGMPFGQGGSRGRELRRSEAPAPTTIGENDGGTTTLSQIDDPVPTTPAPRPTTTIARPTTTAALPPPAPAPAPLPPPAAPPIARPQPPTVRETPAERSESELSEAEATQVLSRFLASGSYYDVAGDCLAVRNLGYANVGYTLEVVDRCEGKSLGNWRVDSKTRELFRQRPDGRYLRP